MNETWKKKDKFGNFFSKITLVCLYYLQQKNMKMEREQKFTEKDNKILIDLIKHKLSPLQKSKKHLFLPGVVRHPKSIHIKQPQPSLASLPSGRIESNPCQKQKQNNQMSLLNKVKEYLQNKRREHHLPEEKNYLQAYIEIFQRPISNVARAKRQSIELNFMEVELYQRLNNNQQRLAYMEKQVTLNEQQRSIFNAKIRRKLNHKKLVDLNRRA